MKKTIYYLLAIIIGNILFLKFYFTREPFRLVALLAVISVAYVIPKFSTSLALGLINRGSTESGRNVLEPDAIKRQEVRSALIKGIVLMLLAGLHVWGYWNYFNYENEDLSNKGIYTPAIVTDIKLKTSSKQGAGVYIYYSYKYNGLIYRHNCFNDTLKKGDTIVVKFSPNNPDHHIIMNRKF